MPIRNEKMCICTYFLLESSLEKCMHAIPKTTVALQTYSRSNKYVSPDRSSIVVETTAWLNPALNSPSVARLSSAKGGVTYRF